MKRIKDKFRKNIDVIIAFLLCGISMYLFCRISVTRYPSQSTLLTGDAMGQYFPAICSFVRNVWNGQSLSYSWSLFLGMNATAYYGTYVGGSFVNFIYLLMPWMSPEGYFCMALTLKTAMAGACFAYFCKKVLGIDGMIPVFFSLFYSMCGFQLGINVINIIWMDAMYLLPLLVVFLTDFLKYGKWKGLVITYAYLFLCNFYMGYIVGFFSALYFIMYAFFYKKNVCKIHKNYVSLFFRYASQVLLAVAMAAFVILPLAMFLMTKNPADSTQANSGLVQHDLLLLFSRFFFGIEVSNFVLLPYLYVGIPTFMLLIVFFISKEIEKKEKAFWGILVFLMILPCMVLPLYMFWHGFDNPDSWYHRFSFILAFLCAAIACKAATALKKYKKKTLVIIGMVELFSSVGIILYGAMNNKHQPSQMLIWNIVLILIWLALLVNMLSLKGKKRKIVKGVAILFAMSEVIINGCLEDRFFQDRATLQVWCDENISASQLLHQDPSFYRVCNLNSINFNTDTWMGFMGFGDFWSFENYECKNALGKLGMFVSPRVLKDDGLNPVTQLLLGVKYNVRNSGEQDMNMAGAGVAQYPYFLGLGFLVRDDLLTLSLNDNYVDREYEPEVEKYDEAFFMKENIPLPEEDVENGGVENVFVNCNELLQSMTGVGNIFVRLPQEEIIIEEHGITLGRKGEDYFLLGDYSDEETKWIDFSVAAINQDIYVAFEGNNEISTSDMPWLYNYYNPVDGGVVGVRYSKSLEQVGDKKVCTVAMAKGTTRNYVAFKEMQFYYVDWNAYQVAYEALSQHQLELTEFKNGYVRGKVQVPSTDQILFTSIPYDSGWKVMAGGEKVETVSLLDGAFLGVKFPSEGTYDLIFEYHAPGAMVGKMISVIAWLLFLVLCFGDRRKDASLLEMTEKEIKE